MRVFVFGSILLLASTCSGSYWGQGSQATHWDHYAVGHKAWHGPQHYPVIVKGVPVETPEVQHAKAAHAAAHDKVSKHDQYLPAHESTHHYAKSYYSVQHVPVIKNGVPVETPEVQHAKAAHAAAHAKAAKYDLYAPIHGDYYGRSYEHHYVPVIKNGFPVETPEVMHAKAAHFAAHVEAKARLHKRSAYSVPQAYVPLDIPEVAAAKIAHLAAHAAAKTGYGSPAPQYWDHHASVQKAWHGPLHYPVIVKGVPVETPEVQHAKAAHAAAYAKVANSDRYIPIYEDQYARNYGSSYGSQYVPVIKNGVPVETPEVQHARAVFFNAYATSSAQARSHGHDDGDDGSYKPELYHRQY
ncbi:pupal cuticle protein-like [Toxorhynchites rutilus septentrionalis]|uniref:pupal cuticle protein-like n=1 Tax=Toxorhynchites rutilus septentrionalis TaxID=329112 RepID=UPI002479A1CF|nr:pupal cuticle protein-like [Toxorhynchites rutilus septentrionalis]